MMYRYAHISILLFLASATINHSFAQKKHSHKFKHTFALAEKNFDYGYYKDALAEYMKIYSEDTNDVELNYKIALCHYNERHHPDSVIPFLLHDDASNIAEVQYLLGKLFHLKHDFKQAELHYEKYKTFPADKRSVNDSEVERLITITRRAKDAMTHPHKGVIINLGKNVNTTYHEYVPLITPDETQLFFTSRRPGNSGKQDVEGNYYEDIYTVTKFKTGWSAPQNIGAPVNSPDHDACVAISADGKYMLLYRPAKDKVNGDLYETRLENGKWSVPDKLGDHINSSEGNESSACISADGQFLFFSSNKPGGFGGKDLYLCRKLPNSQWGLPVNLGPAVNTMYDEDAPFICSDDRVLYFSSKGHNTIGEYDIFKTEFNESDGTWCLPENLGYPVNSVGNDIFFVLCADGYHGYYSSEKDSGFGGEDLYLIDMHYSENDVKIRPLYVFEKGTEGSRPLKAKVTLIDEETRQITGYYTSNLRNGKLIVLVSPFRTYNVTVEAEGYERVSMELEELKPENEEKEIKIELLRK